ncbi:MAG: class I SAM-dependent methyltransferase [Gammaproteobacteria bacterium]|nr:class I SAM-dependent methyltransferase [Rhodoferax sp.]MBU3899549.1 class I SAM-dependent methyltransferase [Gammaproteobacteria bacterium]MBU3997082.1 class I SAM-dependent methyltransferase [Gammaproteobacteria bacterium]MBU4018025.1 class I SAM-dependent methyltransferase [Gammaproteobacteria bacterium]MBU4080284.1 class I SAM-dependent methyltransferase [Gammaproteobacteria bacterium]
MKGRESGMPDEAHWASFFNTEAATEQLLGTKVHGNVIEFGCGYGSFTVPAARRTTGRVTALDIDLEMVGCVRQKALTYDLPNIQADVRDFVANGTGVDAGSQTHAMIFNLLHLEHPVNLLREAYRTLQDGGVLSVIHWRSDIQTPRGPSLAIRPTPEQCRGWMTEAGFRAIESVDLQNSCPFHFGLLARR